MKKSISNRIGIILAISMLLFIGAMLFILIIQEENHKNEITHAGVSQLAQTINQSLEFSMNEGVTDVDPFIEKSKKIKNVSELRVIPVNSIVAGSENLMDKVEKDVLNSKTKYNNEEEFNNEPVMRLVEPLIAEANCITCHDAKVGDPLAIISLRYSLKETNQASITQRLSATIMAVVAILLTFFIIMYFIKKYVIKDLQNSLRYIKKLSLGDISENDPIHREDEIGNLMESINTLRKSQEEKAKLAIEISNGNFQTEIKILSDMDILGKATQGMKDNLQKLVNDLSVIVKEAANGNLSARTDANFYNGEYKAIINGFNETLDNITKPIKAGAAILAQMAEGDFRNRISEKYKGDHKLIVESINAVSDSMSEALSQLNDMVHSVVTATNQISSSTEQMAAGSHEQSTQTSEVAAAVEEMTQTILETSKNTVIANSAATQSKETTSVGKTKVQHTKQSIEQIVLSSQKVENVINSLVNRCKQIADITQIIDEIADQTNLLALNAAIEAARAGESGKGFAVVADEVRKLAERTTNATKEIAQTISTVKKEANAAEDAMQESKLLVESGMENTIEVESILLEINDKSTMVADMITQISSTAEEQSSTAEQISKNIEAISSVIEQSTSGTQLVARSAEDLNRMTSVLQSFVNRFKVSAAKKVVNHRAVEEDNLINV